MMIKQIPLNLLIHSCVQKTGRTVDSWGNATYATSKTINHVRFEPYQKKEISKDNQEITYNLMMFYDASNSTATTFTINDVITYNNTDYQVKEIKELFTDKLHHLEIGLV